jgi:hypothetical protein
MFVCSLGKEDLLKPDDPIESEGLPERYCFVGMWECLKEEMTASENADDNCEFTDLDIRVAGKC